MDAVSLKDIEPPAGEQTSRRSPKGAVKENPDLSDFTTRFRNALAKGVEGIIEAGHVLIEAKQFCRQQYGHGKFTNWAVNELRFGEWRNP